MIKPPEKKWQLLELALKDLRKAERSDKYEVHMGFWYKPNDVCKVCLAGSVMAFSLGVVPNSTVHDREIDPEDLDKEWMMALYSINDMRCGDFGSRDAEFVARQAFRDAGYPNYHGDRPKWFRTMHRCKRILKEANV